MGKRLFCWHCEERIIGRLVPIERFPRCGQCPSWDAGCDDPRCQHCSTVDFQWSPGCDFVAAHNAAIAQGRLSQRTNKDRRVTA